MAKTTKRTKATSKTKSGSKSKATARAASATAASRKGAPKKSASKTAASKTAAAKKAAPKKAAPKKAAANKAAPMKAAAKKAAPKKAAPKKASPMQAAFDAASFDTAPMQAAPMQAAPSGDQLAQLQAEILAMARQLYGDRPDAQLLAMDPNDIDAMNPSMFYELLAERYGVTDDPTNSYFGGFGGAISHTIEFIAGRWDGTTNKTTPMPPQDWLDEYVHPETAG